MEAVLDRPKTVHTKTRKTPKLKTEIVERITLNGISWDTYERILAEHEEVSNPHFAYCDGKLEIMVLGYLHETYKARLSELLIEIARIIETDYESSASTTFRKKEIAKGFEGDDSFYFKNAGLIRTKKEIDLSKDPAPELVIEIDITHGSLSKFPIFAGLEIEEIWRFDGEKVLFYRIKNKDYEEISESVCLPNVKSETVTELLFAAQEMKRIDWVKLVHKTIDNETSG